MIQRNLQKGECLWSIVPEGERFFIVGRHSSKPDWFAQCFNWVKQKSSVIDVHWLCVLIYLIPLDEQFLNEPFWLSKLLSRGTPQASDAQGFPATLKYFPCLLIDHFSPTPQSVFSRIFLLCDTVYYIFLKDHVSMLSGGWCRELCYDVCKI